MNENKSITIKDIAKECGVGVTTVSRALNNHSDINPETKNKIMEVIDKYGFVPNNSARHLKMNVSNCIAVLVKGIGNPFFMKMIGIMEKDIQNHNYSMELRHIDEKTNEVQVALELIKEKKLQGIVFLGGVPDNIKDKITEIGIPFVLSTFSIDDEAVSEPYASVAVDDEKASYMLVSHLIEKGHKKIAIMAANKDDKGICKMRLDGYLRALKEHGIKENPELIWYAGENDDSYSISMESGYSVMEGKLKTNLDFTAAYAISDTMAIGAIRALNEAGKKVPEDVSVAGFDGIELGRYYVPSLTTVSQPFETMAHTTMNSLFDAIEKGESKRKILMDATLIQGESVKAI